MRQQLFEQGSGQCYGTGFGGKQRDDGRAGCTGHLHAYLVQQGGGRLPVDHIAVAGGERGKECIPRCPGACAEPIEFQKDVELADHGVLPQVACHDFRPAQEDGTTDRLQALAALLVLLVAAYCAVHGRAAFNPLSLGVNVVLLATMAVLVLLARAGQGVGDPESREGLPANGN